MSEPLLTETAITSNTSTNLDTSVTTVEDPSPGERPNPPLALRELFFPLSFYALPAAIPVSGPLTLPEATSTNITSPGEPSVYDEAITRIQLLDSYLTPSMRCTLTSMLSVMNMHLTPPEGLATHSLIARVASPEQTPDHCIKDIVDIIDNGLRIFAALGGGSVKKSETGSSTGGPRKRQKLDVNGNHIKSTHRSAKIRADCKNRDENCQICNSNNSGAVSHIIPNSVKDGKGIDFWKFVELFRGVEATAALKAVALAPNPEIVDNLKNVWYLCKICHDNFDRAKLSIIPNLDDLTYPYDPEVTTSYKATVEFPSGKKFTTIACWEYQADGELGFAGQLRPGRVISLTTNNALDLPLPHPLLFQLHALISRVVGLKAAAGFPLFPNFDVGDPDDRGVPAFTDNTFVKWLSHHEQPESDYDAPHEDARYDSGGGKPHIMRWFELTPLSITHVLAPPDSSDSDSDYDAQHTVKRNHVEGYDNDEERPRKYTVVLSEVRQRMLEKQQLGVDLGIDLSELS